MKNKIFLLLISIFILFNSCVSSTKTEKIPEEKDFTNQEILDSESEINVEENEELEKNEEVSDNQSKENLEETKPEVNDEKKLELITEIEGYFESEKIVLEDENSKNENIIEDEILNSEISEIDNKNEDLTNNSSSNEKKSPEDKSQNELNESFEVQKEKEELIVSDDKKIETEEISEKKENTIKEELISIEPNNNAEENEADSFLDIKTEATEIVDIDSNSEEKQEEFETDNNTEAVLDESNNIKKEIIPSRKITMMSNQYLDVNYPGTGWSYLGELDKKSLIRYFGKKLNNNNTTIILRTKDEGKTIVHFYKHDILTDTVIDDYLEIEIKGKNTSGNRVTAPEYVETVPKRSDLNSENKLKAKTEYSVQNEKIIEKEDQEKSNDIRTDEKSSLENISNQESEKINITPEELLNSAKEKIKEKKYSEALSLINDFLNISTENIDEALFLKGKIYESNSNIKNIKEALKAYESIVKNYPKSKYYNLSKDKISYIKMFYLNAR